MLKAHSTMMMRRLYNSNPSIPEAVSKELLDFSRNEASIKSIKSSIARMERVVTNLTSVGDGFSYAMSWESIPVTIFTQLVIVYVIHHPHMFFPMFFLGIALNRSCDSPRGISARSIDACRTLAHRRPRVCPSSEEELERTRERAEAKKKLEEAKKAEAEEEKRPRRRKKKRQGSRLRKPRRPSPARCFRLINSTPLRRCSVKWTKSRR